VAEATNGNAERDGTGKFLRGHRGFGGRPKGARNLLAESFLKDLETTWKRHGIRALEKLAADDPAVLVRVVASVLPKELFAQFVNVNANVDLNLFADAKSYAEAFRLARRHIGADLPPMIEGAIEPEEEFDADNE
jgi:hypothetical protein